MNRRTESLVEFENWEVVRSYLPPDWAEQARRLGAIRRTRYNADPEVILRVLLLHLATGCSLAETAARAAAAGLAKMSAVAVFKKLRAAERWLLWLAQQMRGAAEVPLKLMGRRVRAVDASAVSEPGSTGTDWVIHYAVNVADLQCDFFQLTDVVKGGETFRRVPVEPGDVVMGDRVYAAPPGIAHVVTAKADVIVRLNRQALPLFDRHGRRMHLLPLLRRLKGVATCEYSARVKGPNGWIQGRLIALRQSVEAVRLARRRLRRRAQRNGAVVSPASMEFAQYFMIWTTLPESVTARQILLLYRLRWQIELVFKRMKSILGLGHLPKQDPVSARAWLEGKMFVGLLIERMIRTAESFSPWGYALEESPEPLARG